MTNVIELTDKYIFKTYKRQPLVLVKGRGQYVWDENGRKYLDCFSGLSVTSLGHVHSRVTEALKLQAGRLVHTSNLYYSKPQTALAQELVKRCLAGGSGMVFFSNSGAEANECAIKLARRYGEKRSGRYEIICFENAFHGRTLATLSATWQKKFKTGFGPLLPGFRWAKFNDIDSVRRAISSRTCAIMIEPVQGEGGVNVASRDFFQQLRRLANKHDLLLMADEVQTGLGRCGRFLCSHIYGVKPDVIMLAKGLANGLPIGATVAGGRLKGLMQAGDHGSTFGGGLVTSACAFEVVKSIDNKTLNRITKLGELFLSLLSGLKKECSAIRGVRGLGLMIGIELAMPGDAVVTSCREEGILVNCTHHNVIRLLPPFCITEKDIHFVTKVLAKALQGLSPRETLL